MNSKYTESQLIAILLSREIHDREIGGVGANSAIPIAAVRMAQLSHAPNLCYVSSGGGAINPFPYSKLYPSSTEWGYIERSQGVMELGKDF